MIVIEKRFNRKKQKKVLHVSEAQRCSLDILQHFTGSAGRKQYIGHLLMPHETEIFARLMPGKEKILF